MNSATRVKATFQDYNNKNSPFFRDLTVIRMRETWEIMRAVTSGTSYLHANASVYLPRELRENRPAGSPESEDPWKKRVNLSVLAPFVQSCIRNAAGIVLRRRIKLEGGDPWWEEEFRKNVDGDGTSLDYFALQRLETALTYGMSTLLVDAEKREPGEERQGLLNPCFVPIDPWQYLGHRRESQAPNARLTMFRYQENRRLEKGKYGEEYVAAARVIVPGAYEVFEAGKEEAVESGLFALGEIPVVDIYAKRLGYRYASPPLTDMAHLNIAHYRQMADLLHKLHLAAMGLLVLEEYEGQEAVTGLTYAIRMERGTKAYWVPCDASSFAAQAEMLDRLENEMAHLGVMKLIGQKYVAESADAKRIDHNQANSVLATTAQELEDGLNKAFQLASIYCEKKPPKVVIGKDFDYYRFLGQDVSVLSQLEEKGQITTEVFLQMLQNGEWLPDSVDAGDLLSSVKILKAQIARQGALAGAQGSSPPV